MMNVLIVLILSLLSIVNSLQYNVGTANRMCEYALASYCIGNGGHGVPSWTCNACKQQPGMVNITIVKTGFLNYNSHAFVGYDSVHKVIIVGFAGTDPLSITNWIDDIGFVQIQYPLSTNCNCYVHKGFYETYNAVRTPIWNAVSNLRTLYGASTPVQITGHSLGASLATHCALDGLLSHSIKAQYIYTYGQPRVGDQAFATFYEHEINGNGQLHFHVTHRKDPVPHLPAQSMGKNGYHHMSLEVFYAKNPNATYAVCDGSGEDSKCCDQYSIDVDVLDHLDYLGFDFTTNYLSCKV